MDFKSGGVAAEGNETLQITLDDGIGGVTGDPHSLLQLWPPVTKLKFWLPLKMRSIAFLIKMDILRTLRQRVLWFLRPDGGNFNFTMTEGGTVGSTAITLEANIWPDGTVDLTSGVATSSTTIGSGYNALDFDLVRQGAMLKANSLNNEIEAPQFTGTAKSNVGERLTLSYLPDDELILLLVTMAQKLSCNMTQSQSRVLNSTET